MGIKKIKVFSNLKYHNYSTLHTDLHMHRTTMNTTHLYKEAKYTASSKRFHMSAFSYLSMLVSLPHHHIINL